MAQFVRYFIFKEDFVQTLKQAFKTALGKSYNSTSLLKTSRSYPVIIPCLVPLQHSGLAQRVCVCILHRFVVSYRGAYTVSPQLSSARRAVRQRVMIQRNGRLESGESDGTDHLPEATEPSGEQWQTATERREAFCSDFLLIRVLYF